MADNDYEAEQRRREAEIPFWLKLKWLEEASILALTLQKSPPHLPPDWVRQNFSE